MILGKLSFARRWQERVAQNVRDTEALIEDACHGAVLVAPRFGRLMINSRFDVNVDHVNASASLTGRSGGDDQRTAWYQRRVKCCG